MASSLISPLTFTGVSQFSSDFQSILTRAVQLASLPAQQLQNQQADLQQEQTDISSLGSSVTGLTSSLQALAQLGTSKALTASSTDSSVVTATATGATSAANYTITNVTSVAHAASESSVKSYASTDPVSTTGNLQLTIGSKQYQITLGSGQNNLNGLQSAINNLNAGVSATVLTTSSGAYLSVSANSPGATTLQLADDPTGANTQLLTDTNQGADSVFELNGLQVSEPATNINNLIPGITLSINGTTSPSQTVSVSLSPDPSQLSSALQNLVSAYNSLASSVATQSGTGGGSLTGNPIITGLRQSMLNLVSYTSGSGSIHSLADLGISLSTTGQMSFDPTQLNSLSDSQLNDAFSFLGSATTGFGGTMAAQFTQISDPVSGTIAVQEAQFVKENSSLSDQIAADNDRVNIMQTALQSQLEAADAAAAALQSQQAMLTSNINALNYTTYGQSTLTNQGL
jgi:flagellar hook-associated protein 2